MMYAIIAKLPHEEEYNSKSVASRGNEHHAEYCRRFYDRERRRAITLYRNGNPFFD